MNSIRSSVVALLLSVAMTPASVARAAPAVAATPPATFANGSDVRLVHATYNLPVSVAFGPDGSAYSIAHGGSILRLAPNGARTLVPLHGGGFGTLGSQLVYSNGFLWIEVYHGLERIRVDGSDGRYYSPPSLNGERTFNTLVAGPDGIYYLYLNSVYDPRTRGYYDVPMLAEISNRFKETYITLAPPGPPSLRGRAGFIGALAAGPAGSAYFEAGPLAGGGNFGRVDATGAVTSFKNADPCGPARQLVYARGAFYFVAYAQIANAPASVSLCRVSLTGYYSNLFTTTPAPNLPDAGITADSAGDIWTSNVFGAGLYSYAIPTAAVTGPFDPTYIANISTLYTGPDQNIYFYTYLAQRYFGAYLRHELAIVPTIVSLYSGDPSMDFYVTEPLPSAPWTAYSLNPAIATVAPSSSLPGRFKVTETGIGTTSIVVTDIYGNTSYVPVTAN